MAFEQHEEGMTAVQEVERDLALDMVRRGLPVAACGRRSHSQE